MWTDWFAVFASQDNLIQRARGKDLLHAAFPDCAAFELTHEDKLRQAISRARAMQTNLWVRGKEHVVIGEAKFDPELIDHCLAGARGRRSCGWSFSWNELDPLALTYEELCADYPGT